MGFVLDIAKAGATRAQGKIAAREAETAAKQEELLAVAREADRKERLARVMASQNASAGSRGVAAFEGSPLTILQEDIRREGEATQRDEFMTKLNAMTLRSKGLIAKKQAAAGAFIGLLSDIQKRAERSRSGG